MITAIVFYINSKYNSDATVLYIGTVVIDLEIIDHIASLIGN